MANQRQITRIYIYLSYMIIAKFFCMYSTAVIFSTHFNILYDFYHNFGAFPCSQANISKLIVAMTVATLINIKILKAIKMAPFGLGHLIDNCSTLSTHFEKLGQNEMCIYLSSYCSFDVLHKFDCYIQCCMTSSYALRLGHKLASCKNKSKLFGVS